jgi:hypothetical protein
MRLYLGTHETNAYQMLPADMPAAAAPMAPVGQLFAVRPA